MKQLPLLLLLLGSLALPAQAGLTNGGFETGDLSNWLTTGTTSVVSSTYSPTSPGSGSFSALLTTPSSNNVSALAAFLGVTSNSLIAQGITSGAAISQQFTATVGDGDKIVFNYNFLSNETLRPGGAAGDFAFYRIVPQDSSATTLTTALTLVENSSQSIGFDAETGFTTQVPITINAAGNYTIYFGVVNLNNTSFTSGLLLDNISQIPEPLTLLGVAGLGVWGAAIKRRQSLKKGDE